MILLYYNPDRLLFDVASYTNIIVVYYHRIFFPSNKTSTAYYSNELSRSKSTEHAVGTGFKSRMNYPTVNFDLLHVEYYSHIMLFSIYIL